MTTRSPAKIAAEKRYYPTKRNRYHTDPEYRAGRIEAARRWIEANPDRRLDAELKRRYGISLVEYQAMFDAQGGLCAVCQEPETRVDPRSGKVQRLAVDHCHATGVVRGLLCRRCNHTLGAYKDDPAAFLRLAAYLTNGANA